MKTKTLPTIALLALAVSSPLAFAQEKPAPVPQSGAPANIAALPVANHLVYLAKLPTPAELQKSAAEQGTTITRIDQTSDSIVVVYQYSGGRTETFAYTVLSAASTTVDQVAAPQAPVSPEPTVVYAESAPTTTVVYRDRPVYYEPRYVRYYDPYSDFWGPLALGVGIGWIGGHNYGGGWYGGHGHYGRGRR